MPLGRRKSFLSFFGSSETPFFILYVFSGAVLLYGSWLRWPDAGVDFGFFLYNAWRVSLGARFGVDFHYYYGPLALLFYSALFRVFGPGITLVYAVNLLFLICDVALIHFFFRRFSRSAAALGTLTFLGVFALGQYIFQANYNFLAPYKPEIALGTPLLLWQALLCARMPASRSGRAWAAVGLLAGLLALTSSELALASLGVLAVTVLSASPSAKALAALAGAAVLPPVLCAAYFVAAGVPHPAAAVFQAFGVLTHRSLLLEQSLRELMGSDRPLFRLAIVARVTAVFAVVAALFGILGKNFARRPVLFWGLAALPPVALFVLGCVTPFWLFFPKMLPIFPLAGLLFWVADRARNVALGVWCALSLLLLLRMIGNAMFHYYGFSLAFGATLALFPIFLHALPEMLQRRGWAGRGCAPLAWGLGLSMIAAALFLRQPFFSHKTFPVSGGRDVLFDWDPSFSQRGLAMRELVGDLEKKARANDLALGIPDGHMVNYLLKIPRPAPFALSLGELLEYGEDAILESYRAARPRFVFLIEPEEYDDRGGFGTRYGKSLQAWVKDQYRAVKTYGVPTKFTLYEAR